MSTGIGRNVFISVVVCLGIAIDGAKALSAELFVIGNADHPWEAWGTFDAIDHTTSPGWIQPRRTSKEVNILHELFEAGRLFPFEKPIDPLYQPGDGRIWSPNAPFQENKQLLMIADGLEDSLSFNYFNRLASNNGVSIYIDLGAPYPVDEIIFYPLLFGEHVDLYMKGYELYANDGDPAKVDDSGAPLYHLLDAEPVNTRVTVKNSNFPAQYMRYIRLRCTSPQSFEIDQLEIRGEGYIRRATFTSKLIDLGDLANLGRLLWEAIEEPPGFGAQARIQTRVGNDQTTLIYHRINELGEEEPLPGDTDEENRRAWEALPEAAKGSIVDDTENWSLWSVPYDSSGQLVFAEGPRRYLQLHIILESEEAKARVSVDSIAVEFSKPTMARRLLGEITPRVEVDLGRQQVFTYRVAPRIQAGDTGFDRIQIRVPSEASVQSVRVEKREIPPEEYTVHQEGRWLSVQLSDPSDRVRTDSDTLEIRFQTTVLAYGTVFSGVAFASWEQELLGQYVEERIVGALSVQGSEQSLGEVLGRAIVFPNPFTPNGDGVNDDVSISFKVFQVIGAAPLWISLYDLTGSRIRTLFVDTIQNGPYTVTWDGRDSDGDRVSPGIYLYRIRLEGDAKEFCSVGAITVIY